LWAALPSALSIASRRKQGLGARLIFLGSFDQIMRPSEWTAGLMAVDAEPCGLGLAEHAIFLWDALKRG